MAGLALGAGPGAEGQDLVAVFGGFGGGHGTDARNAFGEGADDLSSSPMGARQGESLTGRGDDDNGVQSSFLS